jgi:hypothetical protein
MVVVSSTCRNHLEANPDATYTKISDEFVLPSSALAQLKWATSILRASNVNFGVSVPDDPINIINVRYAAQVLGMELYVRHFVRAYKTGLRERTPTTQELEYSE